MIKSPHDLSVATYCISFMFGIDAPTLAYTHRWLLAREVLFAWSKTVQAKLQRESARLLKLLADPEFIR